MPETPATVALLEDDPNMRERLAAVIIANPRLELVYCGESSRDCMAWLADHPVRVLLVDLGLPHGSGIDVIRHCRALHPACDAMVITMLGDEANMLQAFAAGARGYLLKDGTERDLVRHVLDLRAGGSPMSPIMARRLLQVWHGGTADAALVPTPRRPERVPHAAPIATEALTAPIKLAAAARPEALTPREAEVLALVARGFIYDEVAARMELSITTVRTHVHNIYGKLDVHNKAEVRFQARALDWPD